MLSFIVQDIKKVVDHLREANIAVIGEIQRFAYGKMVHIIDPEENVIELWEPNNRVST